MSIKLSRKPFEDIVKSYLIVAPEASMPSPGVQGRLFISSDTLKIFIDSGAQWVLVGELRGLSLAFHSSRHAYSAEDPLPPNSVSSDQIASVDWNKVVNKPSTYPPSPHTHSRSDVTDFWSAPFWGNIPDKPSTYPPSPHTHSRGDITDFWATPFWGNIPDKPSTYPPSPHTHDASDIVSGTLSPDRIADGSITRAKLEYPTVDVNFVYLAAIGKTMGAPHDPGNRYGVVTITSDRFADKAVDAWIWDRWGGIHGRYNDRGNWYRCDLDNAAVTADFMLNKSVAGTKTTLGTESVDIAAQYAYLLRLSISGSTLKGYRAEPTGLANSANATATPKVSATDTSFASGSWGPFSHLYGGGHSEAAIAWLRAPSSPLPPARAVLELDIEGSGKPGDPYRPSLSKNLVEITSLAGLSDFLYQEAKKYEILVKKGFTEDEMKLVFGSVPQHQVDLDSVTWGAFEFSEKSPTNIIMIYGDNPYKAGAIKRQMDYVKSKNLRVFTSPKNYGEAIALYNQLKKDYPHWLAGKDNFAYQVLGWEELDWLQNVDFYYGELIEHKTHYDLLRRVPDWEIRNRLLELRGEISRMTILTDERDKHLKKIDEILRRGW